MKIEKTNIYRHIATDSEWAEALHLPNADLLVNSILVLTDEIKEFGPNDILTMSAGPCRLVLLYDSETKRGLAGHFDMIEGQEIFDAAERFFPQMSRVEVVLTGGAPGNANDRDLMNYLQYYKNEIEASLQNSEIPSENIFPHWTRPSLATSLLFTPREGRVDITFSEANDNDFDD